MTIQSDATIGGPIGRPVSRVDGRAKVTGAAKYAAEFNVPGLVYGTVMNGAVARGRILKIDASRALALPGVLQVFTHENRPRSAWSDRSYQDDDSPSGSPFRPLNSAGIVYSGQPVALVVAETLELSRYAASLVRIQYESQPHQTDLSEERSKARKPREGKDGYEPPPKPRGDAARALAESAARVDVEIHFAVEHHNPMEMHASTVVYEDDGSITVYDKTQGVLNTQEYISKVFNLPADQVRVRSPFVGGAFGSGLRPQYPLYLAVMAALGLKRSVRVALSRPEMFTFGHRPETFHRLTLGASADGKLESVTHTAVSETSRFEDYIEIVVNWSGMLYQCDNVKLDYKVASLDVYTPLDMCAPGAASGVNAFEMAIDELAYAAGVDPLEFRLKNHSDRDQNSDKPYSSKELRACYRQGAERFGWAKRNAQPRSRRDGKHLIGWGVATGIWDTQQQKASARAVLGIDGKLTVGSATSDIGTGTYTVMCQIAAESLGLPVENVTFKLGDSSLPQAPLEGGSFTVSSVGSAVKMACDAIAEQVFAFALEMDGSPLGKAKRQDVAFGDGRVYLKVDPSKGVLIIDAMRAGGVLSVEEQSVSTPQHHKQSGYTRSTHSAVFVEVRVDEDLGTIGVSRVVSAIAGGRIINPKTARSQIIGGVVWGIGMALQEETLMDHNLGRFMNHDLAEYHIPVNADVHDIDVIFVEEHDTIVNPLGAKGLGEIGIVGVAAAISNAVFHATGTRVRKFPITLDKLL